MMHKNCILGASNITKTVTTTVLRKLFFFEICFIVVKIRYIFIQAAALPYFLKLVAIDGRNQERGAESHKTLAFTYEKLGYWEDALKAYQVGITQQPRSSELMLCYCTALITVYRDSNEKALARSPSQVFYSIVVIAKNRHITKKETNKTSRV